MAFVGGRCRAWWMACSGRPTVAGTFLAVFLLMGVAGRGCLAASLVCRRACCSGSSLAGFRVFKFGTRYALSGKAWNNLFDNKTAFSNKKDYGKEEREAQWAPAQRTLHGLQPPEASGIFHEKSSYRELSEIAEQAKRRAEVARLRELYTLKGHVDSVVKLKNLDIDTINSHYTV